MTGLNPYLVGYVFRVLWQMCHPSELPEVICTRLVGVDAITPTFEDQSTGIREYRVNAKIDAESGERAIEIVHRWFAHLPGATVIRFAARCLTPGSPEPVFSSDTTSADLFASAESAASPMALTQKSDNFLWQGYWCIILKYRQQEVSGILSRSGLTDIEVMEDRGGEVVVNVRLEFQCDSPLDGVAEQFGWNLLADKLAGVNWGKKGAALGHKLP